MGDIKGSISKQPINYSSSIKNEDLEHVGKNELSSLGVVKQFEFSSALQRMSVLTLNHESKTLTAYVKGAPEMIHSLSDSSKIPTDFFDVLEKYTQDGLRVLALGYKDYDDFGKKTPFFLKISIICRVFVK